MAPSKAVAAVLSVAFALTCDAEPTTVGERALEIVTSSYTRHARPVGYGIDIQRRRDQQVVNLSEQCSSDSTDLQANPDVLAAQELMGKDCQEFIAAMEEDPIVITVDFTDCPAASDFGDACTAAGGRHVTAPTANITCAMQDGQGQKFALIVDGFPVCIGSSCELDGGDVEAWTSGALEAIESELEGGFGARCERNVAGEEDERPNESFPPTPAPPPAEDATPDGDTTSGGNLLRVSGFSQGLKMIALGWAVLL